ncbi:MAG: Fibronectin type domain protein [bacterium]|nr:Fibronectin type domain protein [bacterium]
MKRHSLIYSLGLAISLAGCGDGNKQQNSDGGGTTIVTQSLAFRIDNLPATAKPGDSVSFTLTVVDGSGNAFTGYKGTVKFESNDSSATLPANFTFTGDAQQNFSAQFKFPGKWALRATDSAAAAPTASAFITIQGPATRLIKVSGDAQTGAAGAKLPSSLVVKAIDDGGNPVAGVGVQWSSIMGGGSITPASVMTGADGTASADATLGPSGTSYSFQAAVTSLVGSPVVFTSQHGPFKLVYTDPTGGKLRLVKNAASTATTAVLDLVIGATAQSGYSAGFNLPIDDTKVKLKTLTPGTVLGAGSAPVAAKAVLPTAGPLKGVLVSAQSQKASGTGAITTDTALPASTVLYTIKLDLLDTAAPGVVFDGTASGFMLKSGGLRNKAGTAVVNANEINIGKLEVQQ